MAMGVHTITGFLYEFTFAYLISGYSNKSGVCAFRGRFWTLRKSTKGTGTVFQLHFQSGYATKIAKCSVIQCSATRIMRTFGLPFANGKTLRKATFLL